MPLLAPKKGKSDPPSNTARPTATADTGGAATGPATDQATGISKRQPSLTVKASSSQLRPASPADGRSGLKRGNSRSWYGSFNNKAAAIAQVAKESISVSGGSTSESSDPSSRSPYIHNSLRRSRKSIPAEAEATKVNATGSKTDLPGPVTEVKEEKMDIIMAHHACRIADTPVSEVVRSEADQLVRNSPGKQLLQSGGWFGWWSRPDDYPANESEKPKDAVDGADQAQQKGTTTAPAKESSRPQTAPAGSGTDPAPMAKPAETTSRGWFGLWSASQNERESEPEPTATVPDNAELPAVPSTPAPKENKTDSGRPPLDRPKSSGWAFWSKDSPSILADDSQKHLGELAVADTPSQSHPEAAQFNATPTKKGLANGNSKNRVGKNAKKSIETNTKSNSATSETENKVQKQTLQTDTAFATSTKATSTEQVSDRPELQEVQSSQALKALKAHQGPVNIIEPRFRTTYPRAHVSSYWETLGYYISLPFGSASTASATAPHVSIAAQRPKIKNAIAIGIHGYFPGPLLQKLIGQPTGTSIKFATHAAAAIRAWTEKYQPDVPCEVEQVALEGEGYISDRVATLWKLLLNWLTHLRNADVILVAAHSQGVPVAVMLVAKLIQLGCLNPNAKVGICAMAGVNLGPFADYKSRFFGGSAAELFDFSNSQSRVSLEYASSLEVVLRHGVKVTYVGSMDDQLVSLESSLFANVTHPHIQRAVFIDGRLHAQDFVAHLVAFALKLRNLGISDHGLLRELSAPLAGSIYTGEGHSRIYDDEAVYEQALEYALETTDMDAKTYMRITNATSPQAQPTNSDRKRPIQRRHSSAGVPRGQGDSGSAAQPGIAPVFTKYGLPPSSGSANPYFLPWALRGMLEEPAVKSGMQDEVEELLRLFDEWKPASKVLKDVRFRLEAVKSKL